jgi:hypothetical protein
MTTDRSTDDASLEGPDVETTDGITDETGEYGPGVDQDTGANVGDTGTPELDEGRTERIVDDELAEEEERDE